MSSEIVYQFQSYLSNGTLKDQYASSSQSANQTNARIVRNVQTIGTSPHEALVKGDIASIGLAVFQNLDSTNYVEIGVDVSGTFYPFLKLLAGYQCMCWMGVNSIYAQANTGDVKLFYILYDQ